MVPLELSLLFGFGVNNEWDRGEDKRNKLRNFKSLRVENGVN